MGIPFGQDTRKRQGAFFLVAGTYVLVYSFGVKITGAREVGLSIEMPAGFAPTFLFAVSIFLGVRYALEVWGEFNFFEWMADERRSIRDICSSIRQCQDLLLLSTHDFDDYTGHILTSQTPTMLPGELNNFRSRLVAEFRKNGREAASEMLEGGKRWLGAHASSEIRRLRMERLRRGVGLINVWSLVVFDIVLPAALFLLVIVIFVQEPEWPRQLAQNFY